MSNIEIKNIADPMFNKLKNLFLIEDIQYVIEENSTKVIFETGVGGYAPDSHMIYIYFDSKNPNTNQNLEAKIKSTLSHEFHHAIRNRKFDWKKDTLLGAIITEGLADHFDIEINGGEPRIWNTALLEEQIQFYIKIIKEKGHIKDFKYEEWFFGTKEIPKWAGYTIGFKLVEEYIKKTNKKASELVWEKSECFI